MPSPAITRAWAVVDEDGEVDVDPTSKPNVFICKATLDYMMSTYFVDGFSSRPVMIVPRELFDALVAAAAAGAGVPVEVITAALENGDEHERELAARLKGKP